MSESDLLARWRKYAHVAPYNRELNLLPHAINPDWCVLAIDYRDELVGDPESGVLHGGVITALLDATFGFAIFAKLPQLRQMATLDLRIDYLKPATPGRKVLGGATCYKLTSQLAFVRGAAYHDTPDDPISTAVGIFMFTDSAPMITDGARPT